MSAKTTYRAAFLQSSESTRKAMIVRCVALAGEKDFYKEFTTQKSRRDRYHQQFDFMYLKERLMERFVAGLDERREAYATKVSSILSPPGFTPPLRPPMT